MNKTDLIDAIYEETEMTKIDVGTVIYSMLEIISNYCRRGGQE